MSLNVRFCRSACRSDADELVCGAGVDPLANDTSWTNRPPDVVDADALDAVQPLHDSLKSQPLWWILEVLPFFVSWQDESGNWHRRFRYIT